MYWFYYYDCFLYFAVVTDDGRIRWKDFDLWSAMVMVLYVTHYYYDGLDLDFVNDDLDANRVKIVDTHGATIAETVVGLMNLFFLFCCCCC